MKRSIFKSQLWKFKIMGLTAVSLIEDTMIDGVIMTKVCDWKSQEKGKNRFASPTGVNSKSTADHFKHLKEKGL